MMKETILAMFPGFLILFIACSIKCMREHYQIFKLQEQYCKIHQEDSLHTYKLCKSDLVTFYQIILCEECE